MGSVSAPQRSELTLTCRECSASLSTSDILDWTFIAVSCAQNLVRVAMCPHVPDGITIQSPDFRRP